MTDRQFDTTHAPGCWGRGPRHYECAVGQIERRLYAGWAPEQARSTPKLTPTQAGWSAILAGDQAGQESASTS